MATAAANRQFSDALDLAYLEMASGAFTPQEACFKVVKKLGTDGIKCVNYVSGRTDQIDVAVRRAIVMGIGKTCGDMQLDLAHEIDCQLVEVSSHLGACSASDDLELKDKLDREFKRNIFCTKTITAYTKISRTRSAEGSATAGQLTLSRIF